MQAHRDLVSLLEFEFESEFSIAGWSNNCVVGWKKNLDMKFRYKFGLESTPDHLTAPLFLQAARRHAMLLSMLVVTMSVVDPCILNRHIPLYLRLGVL